MGGAGSRHQGSRRASARGPRGALARAATPDSRARFVSAASIAGSEASSRRTAREHLDASLLLIPLVGFLPANDPRVQGTLDAVGEDLMVDGLVRRYHTTQTEDGLPPGEGAFLACSFWYVDNLAMVGRQSEARELFEHLLGLRNDVGLLAEEYDPRASASAGQFSAGLLARRADRFGIQPQCDRARQAGASARLRSGRRLRSEA